MKIRTRITVGQSQRLALNTALSSAISVLRADAAGLTAMIEEQAAANPQLVVTKVQPSVWTPRWHDALSRLGRRMEGEERDAMAEPSLIAHVMAAVEALRLSPRDYEVALAFVNALEPSGWLSLPLREIAREVRAKEAEALKVLAKLQTIEPTGLFARDLADCLRLQAREAEEADPLMEKVLDHLPLVAKGHLAELAALCGVSEAEIRQRIQRLRGYNPKPGAAFAQGAAPVSEPDLIVEKGATGWEVSLNNSSLPSLSLAEGKGTGRAAARSLIKLIEGRNATLLKVAQEILARQEAVLDHGMAALLPMTMGEIAETVGLHQTTVSRVVAGTSVDTPRGTFWLRALFSTALGENGPSNVRTRAELARLIAAENPKAPLSDTEVAEALAAIGAKVARRTVAKYREALGIPPAHRRRLAS